ncbi:SET domain [Macleaya cordata]|uniref:SET domain n=1 Tax=Macleaya cordata TaxID=56857 RepID=A0A200QLE2_MACCD|nr:SET domain [Macleaya cordata]
MGVSINGDNAIVDNCKRRKVSAIRDFPEGCGRFAAKRDLPNGCGKKNPVVAGSAENLKVGSQTVIDSGKLEVGRIPESIESLHPPKASKSETLMPVEALDEGETLTAMEAVGTLVVEISKAVDQTELISPSKTLQSVKDLEGSQSKDALKNSSQPEAKDSLSGLQQLSTMDVMTDAAVLSDVPEEPEILLPNVGSIRKQYPPRRRISATRDFPPGCGRNAPRLSQKERLKINAPTQNQSVKNESFGGENRQVEQMVKTDAIEIRENVQNGDALRSKLKRSVMKDFVDNVRVKSDRDVMKAKTEQFQVRAVSESKLEKEDKEENTTRSPATRNLPQSEKSLSVSKRVDRENAGSGRKLGKESLQINRDNSFKRKIPGNSEDASRAQNQSHGEVSIGLGPSNERMIVQALMAAPNCPWRQAKWGFKTPTQEATRSKVNKQESVVHARKKAVAENSERKSTKGKAPSQVSNQLVISDDEEDSPRHHEADEKLSLVPRPQDASLRLIPFGLHTLVDKDDNIEATVTRKKVRETLRLFQAIFRKLLRDEEAKSKEQGTNSKRIDLISAKILKEKNKWVNTGKQIVGPVAGVEVGDEFHYRVELAIVGLHRPFQGGIDYLNKGGRVLATSIVASGGYADDMDSTDVLVYCGQGGNPMGVDKQAEDQKLERGNLALKNSMDDKSPVRVVRGFKETKGSDSLDARGKMVATYTYDGVYLVERYWQERGRYGNNVFMFQLRRIPGQPELALKEVKKSKKSRVREGLCVDDISQGREKMPICAVNTIDNEKPPPFKYITNMIYSSRYDLTPPKGCECTDGCSDSEKCICAVKNGGEIPFNYNGAIVEAKPLVYECGPSCKCPPSCHNRVSQHGIKFQLEIFKTESRGWGVRSLTSIPSGSFICEYTGELLEDKEAEQRTGNDEYLFDIGSNYNDQTLWDGLSNLIPPDLQSSFSCVTMEDVGFTIDAAEYGSVGRFINHSCSPNLYAQNVLYDHDDKRMPHIMLFAAENIPPLQELTYHYNYVLDQVRDSAGNIKKKDCYCGSLECTGRMY